MYVTEPINYFETKDKRARQDSNSYCVSIILQIQK